MVIASAVAVVCAALSVGGATAAGSSSRAGARARRHAAQPARRAAATAWLAGAGPLPGAGPVRGAGALAGASRIGRAPATEQVRLVLPLKVDAAGLDRQAQAVSTPGSPEYRRFASVATISHLFGASDPDRRLVVAYLRANGGGDVGIDATGLFAHATMFVGRAEALFATPVMGFRAADGTRFIAPVSAVRVPRRLARAVTAVLGLDTQPVLEGSAQAPQSNVFARAAASTQPSSEHPRDGTPSGCAAGVAAGEVNNDPGTGAYTPNQYLSAYNYDLLHGAGLQGQGQRVALIEADGVIPSDVASFATCFGFPVPHINQFAVGGIKKPAPGLEAILDAEVLDAAAPGLSAMDVYETKPNLSDMLRAFSAPLQHPRSLPAAISISLGLCEAQAKAALGLDGPKGLKTADLVLAAATLSGVTVVSAAGDTGSAGCQRRGGLPSDQLGVLYPASSIWSVAVGGTNLFLSATNDILDEVVWNDTTDGLGAGGGGFSSLLNRPPAQNGVVSVNHRALPDISMLADAVPGYATFCTARDCRKASRSSPWLRAGGTSAAAPLFAGAVGLIDQKLHAVGRAPLGDVESFLYVAGRSPTGQAIFNDVTRVGNDIGPFIAGSGGQPLGCCTAGPGYDEASGWGSVNVTGFEQLIEQLAPLLPPPLGRVVFRVLGGQHPIKTGSIVTQVSCSETCHVLAEVDVSVGSGRPFDRRSRIYRLRTGGSKRIVLKFTASQIHQLRAGLARHKQIAAVGWALLTNAAQRPEKYSTPIELELTS